MKKKTENETQPEEIRKTGIRFVMFGGNGQIMRIDYDNGGEQLHVATLVNGVLTYESEETKAYHARVVSMLREHSVSFDQVAIKGEAVPAAPIIAEPVRAGIPPPPPRNKRDGDKTPAYVDWMRQYYPEEFKLRYGVIGDGEVTKYRKIPDPEVVGRFTQQAYRQPALLARRKIHLTEKPITKEDDGYAPVPDDKEEAI